MNKYHIGDYVTVKMHNGGAASGKIIKVEKVYDFTHYTIKPRKGTNIIAIQGRETFCDHECEITGYKEKVKS